MYYFVMGKYDKLSEHTQTIQLSFACGSTLSCVKEKNRGHKVEEMPENMFPEGCSVECIYGMMFLC